MNRDLVLAVLALGVCGAAVWLAGWVIPRQRGEERSGREGVPSGLGLEHRAWLRLWMPLLPAALALAALVGWGLQEPGQTDELLRPLTPLLVAPFAMIWLRAGLRAARALRIPASLPVAGTVGLVRPRVVLDARFAVALDGAQRAAVLAHEQAHARHRDPLRIWLAQFVTDLQWPVPAAARRFDEWSSRLELARDEEARQRGIAGEDLAAAIVAAARLGSRPMPGVASLTGPEQDLMARVRRLLSPLPAANDGRGRWVKLSSLGALVAATLILAVLAGVHFGDALVRPLPLIV